MFLSTITNQDVVSELAVIISVFVVLLIQPKFASKHNLFVI